MALGDIVRKAKGYARQNPEKTKQMLDKIESTVDQKTQGKYRDKVGKASNAVGGALGVERDGQDSSGREVPSGEQQEAHRGQASVSGQEVPSGEQQEAHRGQASVSGQEVPSGEQQEAHRGQASVSGQEVPREQKDQ